MASILQQKCFCFTVISQLFPPKKEKLSVYAEIDVLITLLVHLGLKWNPSIPNPVDCSCEIPSSLKEAEKDY